MASNQGGRPEAKHKNKPSCAQIQAIEHTGRSPPVPNHMHEIPFSRRTYTRAIYNTSRSCTHRNYDPSHLVEKPTTLTSTGSEKMRACIGCAPFEEYRIQGWDASIHGSSSGSPSAFEEAGTVSEGDAVAADESLVRSTSGPVVRSLRAGGRSGGISQALA